MESRIDRERSSVTIGGDETLISLYRISIEWMTTAMDGPDPGRGMPRGGQGSVSRLPEDVRIAVGIERFDYTKGIVDRMRAVDDPARRTTRSGAANSCTCRRSSRLVDPHDAMHIVPARVTQPGHAVAGLGQGRDGHWLLPIRFAIRGFL